MPSALNLCLKSHIHRIIGASLGLGTSSHVLFANRASYSLDMAIFQFGSVRAVRWDLGKGEMEGVVSVFKDSGTRGLNIPERERVCMG